MAHRRIYTPDMKEPPIAIHKSHEPERLINDSEVASLLGISERTAITRRQCGDIPFIRVGRLIRYHWPDVLAHIRRATPKHGNIR